jgi:hypothetical protein
MKFAFSRRKAAFLASFAMIPAAFWALQVGPALDERAAFVERQDKAHVVRARNSQMPGQRDQLSQQWEEFKPSIASALDNLSSDLNPHLVQKRIFASAQELGCRVKIARMAAKDDANFIRFSLTGEGAYSAIVKFIDQLEQGQHYVRFERLQLELPDLDAGVTKSTVRISAVMLIPFLPGITDQAATP